MDSIVLVGETGRKEDTDLSHMKSKPLTKGEQYVKSGNVREVMGCTNRENYYVKAKDAASMKNELRHVNISISGISGAVLDASCTCPGSALHRCNHVAPVLISINRHCKHLEQDSKSCTSKPCEWNKGKQSNKTPVKVNEAEYQSYKTKRMKLSRFDPRPPHFRGKVCD